MYVARRIAKQCAWLAATNLDAGKVARSILTTKDTNHTKKTTPGTFVSFVYFVVHILAQVTFDWLSLSAVDTILERRKVYGTVSANEVIGSLPRMRR